MTCIEGVFNAARTLKFGAALDQFSPDVHTEAVVSAARRGDGGTLVGSAPNCVLSASPNHPLARESRGFSQNFRLRRFIITLEMRVEVPSTDPPARAGSCVP